MGSPFPPFRSTLTTLYLNPHEVLLYQPKLVLIHTLISSDTQSNMPQSKPKPSEIALEAKRKYLPGLEASEQWRAYMCGSFLIKDTAEVSITDDKRSYGRPRVTVEDGDPVNTVIGARAYGSMALVNTANERKAGGDWESGFTAAEECLARRSTLIHALKHSYQSGGKADRFYPIPQRGSIYSPHVVIFRDGEKGSYRPYE